MEDGCLEPESTTLRTSNTSAKPQSTPASSRATGTTNAREAGRRLLKKQYDGAFGRWSIHKVALKAPFGSFENANKPFQRCDACKGVIHSDHNELNSREEWNRRASGSPTSHLEGFFNKKEPRNIDLLHLRIVLGSSPFGFRAFLAYKSCPAVPRGSGATLGAVHKSVTDKLATVDEATETTEAW